VESRRPTRTWAVIVIERTTLEVVIGLLGPAMGGQEFVKRSGGKTKKGLKVWAQKGHFRFQ